jgi:hypothetical protein
MIRGNGPRERLRPHHGGTFTLPDDNYFRLELRRDSSGTVDAMLFHEATGIYLVEGELAPDQDVYPSRLPAQLRGWMSSDNGFDLHRNLGPSRNNCID